MSGGGGEAPGVPVPGGGMRPRAGRGRMTSPPLCRDEPAGAGGGRWRSSACGNTNHPSPPGSETPKAWALPCRHLS